MTSGLTNNEKSLLKEQAKAERLLQKEQAKAEKINQAAQTWLTNHPGLYNGDPAEFTFSKIKDLDLENYKYPNKPSTNTTTKQTSKFSISDLKQSLSTKTWGNTNTGSTTNSSESLFSVITKGKVTTNRSVPTTPYRVKNSPTPMSGNTNSEPQTKMLLKSGLSLSEPATIFTAGTVDYSFPNGDGYGFDDNIYDIVIQPDGKILVAGESNSYYYYNGDSWPMRGLIRLNSDGTVDESFSIIVNEDCYGGGFNGPVNTIALQADGKILCGGYFNSFDRDGNCNDANSIIRLNSDGSRDTTFNTGNGFDSNVFSIAVQSNGKILVGGYFTSYNGTTAYYMIRLNSTGSIDTTFNIGSDTNSFNDYVNKIVIQPNGKILCGGNFTSYSGVQQNYIVRLNSNGTLDTTFQTGGGFNSEVITMALQSDGKIIAGGYFTSFNNNDAYYIVRLDTDGNLNNVFGYGFNSEVLSLAIQSNDKILVGGEFTEFYPPTLGTLNIDELVRFNADCSFDYGFYYEELFNSYVNTIAIQNDGKILVGGHFNTNNDPATFPLNYFGRLNNVITTYPYVYLGWTDFCTDGNGIVKTVGSMTAPTLSIYGPENVYSFNVLSQPSQIEVGIAIPGYTDFFGYPTNQIELTQGTDYGSYFDNGCVSALINNCKLVVANSVFDDFPPLYLWVNNLYNVGDIAFLSHSGNESGNNYFFHATIQIISELNPNFYSATFDSLPILQYNPYQTIEQSVVSNGEYIVQIDCTEQTAIPVLVKQYSLLPIYDTTYYSMLDNDSPCKFGVDTISYFEQNNDETFFSILTANTSPIINSTLTYNNCNECLLKSAYYGEINGNFNDGDGFDGYIDGFLVYTTVEQPDGKILVGGNFENYENVTVGSLVRLNIDGTIDTTFNTGGSGFDGYVRAIALQPDGKILVGGYFESYNGIENYNIIRLNSNGTIDTSFFTGGTPNDIVRAIAIQKDGKILVGGDFSEYNGLEYQQIVRLNSNGTVDTTFNIGNGFGNGRVFVIKIEETIVIPFYAGTPVTYTYKYIVGGQFETYNYYNTASIVMIDENGDPLNNFGGGFNQSYRVTTIEKQSDGKFIIGGQFSEYNFDATPYNIVRLNTDYTVDNSFIGSTYNDGGGFNDGRVLSIQILPNDKIFVGGQSYYFQDINDDYEIGYFVKLNSDGTLDTTFTYEITDNYVNKVLLLSNGSLLVGGWFETPKSLLVNLFIGEENLPRTFETCDGQTTNIYLPEGYTIKYPENNSGVEITKIDYVEISTSGLDLALDGSYDDEYWTIDFPSGFGVNFLGNSYTSVNISSNPFITFGDPNDPNIDAGNCCFDIPNQIPAEVGLPGVYISFQCPNNPGDYDGQLYQLYSGLTDGGNTLVFKYLGSDHCDNEANLVYGFKFYKNKPNYFDLVIESNNNFFNDDPTGGVSNAVSENWLATFESSSSNSYRLSSILPLPIKANINTTNLVCGTIGDVIYTPESTTDTDIISGSMLFNGEVDTMVQVDNGGGQFGFGGVYNFTIEWFQYYTGGTNSRPFSIGVYSELTEIIGMSFEGSVYLWIGNSANNTNITNDDILNGWHHIAITRYFDGVDHIWRVFLDGVQTTQFVDNTDTTNTYTLTLGNQLDNDGRFGGYITNFRVVNLEALYTSNFTVPTSPLADITNTILLMLAANQTNLITDSTDSQTITQTGVTWSNETPFKRNIYYTVTGTTAYNDCDTCTATTTYNATLLVRDGIRAPFVNYVSITKENIDKIKTYGPLSTNTMGGIRGIEVYELLNYYL